MIAPGLLTGRPRMDIARARPAAGGVRGAWPSLMCVVVAVIAVGGCGGASGHSSTFVKEARRLARPLYPSCGTRGLGRPHSAVAARVGWEVAYAYPSHGPRLRPGQTTGVTILERPPDGPRGRVAGGRNLVIGGRDVSFRARTVRTVWVAQWKTRSARYLALADGSKATTIKRVIGCLP